LPNAQYTYTLVVVSRGDILPVSGSFSTSAGADTTTPNGSILLKSKDSHNRLFGITPVETLKALLVTLTDQVTQVIKRYYFFNIAANVASLFLLDSLDAGRLYAIKWLMFDTSGNIGGSTMNIIVSTPLYDETPPALSENALTDRTDTTATLHLVTNELLKRLRIRYRLIGAYEWLEQELIPTALEFDVNLAGLVSGQGYEYQYILEDSSGNQTITEWAGV